MKGGGKRPPKRLPLNPSELTQIEPLPPQILIKQAQLEGEAKEISHLANDAGLRFPTYVTKKVWADLIIPDEYSVLKGETEESRAWLLAYYVPERVQQHLGTSQPYKVFVHFKNKTGAMVSLKASSVVDQDENPMLLISYPNEM